jgi:hypothetical protein
MSSRHRVSNAEKLVLVQKTERTIIKLSEWLKNIEPFTEVRSNLRQEESFAINKLIEASAKVNEHIQELKKLMEYCSTQNPYRRNYDLFMIMANQGEIVTLSLERAYFNLDLVTQMIKTFDDKERAEQDNV